MVMVVAGMRVRIGSVCTLLSCQLLGGGCLSLRVEVFDFSLAKDATLQLVPGSEPKIAADSLHPSVARRRAVNVWLVDDEEDLILKALAN